MSGVRKHAYFALHSRKSRVDAILPCSLRASTRDALLMEQGVAPADVSRDHVPGCDAIVRPDEGPPSVAGRDRVKGQGNEALGKGSSRTVRSKLERRYRKKSPQWSAGRRAGLIAKARGRLRTAPLLHAPSRRSAPSLM